MIRYTFVHYCFANPTYDPTKYATFRGIPCFYCFSLKIKPYSSLQQILFTPYKKMVITTFPGYSSLQLLSIELLGSGPTEKSQTCQRIQFGFPMKQKGLQFLEPINLKIRSLLKLTFFAAVLKASLWVILGFSALSLLISSLLLTIYIRTNPLR